MWPVEPIDVERLWRIKTRNDRLIDNMDNLVNVDGSPVNLGSWMSRTRTSYYRPPWLSVLLSRTNRVWKGDCGLKEGFPSFFSPSLPVPILPPSLFFPPYLPSSFLPSPLLSCSYVAVSVHLDSREELIIGGEGRIVEMESWGRREEMNTRAQAEGLIFDRIRVMSHTLGSDTLGWSILWERSYNCLYIFCH